MERVISVMILLAAILVTHLLSAAVGYLVSVMILLVAILLSQLVLAAVR